jgi:hypothetical protein
LRLYVKYFLEIEKNTGVLRRSLKSSRCTLLTMMRLRTMLMMLALYLIVEVFIVILAYEFGKQILKSRSDTLTPVPDSKFSMCE